MIPSGISPQVAKTWISPKSPVSSSYFCETAITPALMSEKRSARLMASSAVEHCKGGSLNNLDFLPSPCLVNNFWEY